MPTIHRPSRTPGRGMTVALVLWAASLGAAEAQSTAAAPPTAPSAPQVGSEARAPADPATALPPAGGTGAAARPRTSGTPLKGDTTPPGLTKAGQ